jgi:RND family efflux transporter MFP subunit
VTRIPFLLSVAIALTLSQGIPWARSAEAADLDCLIEPYVIVQVSAAVDGLLDKVSVDRGDLVKEGQVLAELESSIERAAVAVARVRAEMESGIKSNQVRIDFGERRFVRTDLAYKEGGLPLKDVDEAETSKVLAEIGLMEAQENKRLAEEELKRATDVLALRTVRSPITGVVIQRFLFPGEFTKQSPILKLAQIDPLHVEVFAPVAMLGKIAVGMRAEVLPEAPVGGVHIARVKVVDPVIDAASGTFGVRLELPNSDYRLPAGLRCKVRFPR